MTGNRKASDKRVIYTHQGIDLDSCLAIIALQTFLPEFRSANFEFVDANWDEVLAPGEIAIDLAAGGQGIKGDKDPDGTVHSAFKKIVELYGTKCDQRALAPLIALVDANDAYGDAVMYLAPELNREKRQAFTDTSVIGIFRALKSRMRKKSDGGSRAEIDFMVMDAMKDIFLGLHTNGLNRLEAEENLDACIQSRAVTIVQGGRVAIIDTDLKPQIQELLMETRGIRAIVYANGKNLGARRANGEAARMDHEIIRAVVTQAGEVVGNGQGTWFAHTSGFLFAWGTNKAPAQRPSKVDALDLARAVDKVLLTADQTKSIAAK